jgi:hypothetical protein
VCSSDLPFLPSGKTGAPWRSLLNEIQMLFFQSEVNRRREQQGQLPINGLWLWGGGTLPRIDRGPWQQICATHPLARGLAQLAGLPLITTPPPEPAPGPTLWLWDELLPPVLDGDPQAWAEALERLEPIIAGQEQALARRHLGCLYLYPCNGKRCRLTPGMRYRFWRRTRPIAGRLDAADSP